MAALIFSNRRLPLIFICGFVFFWLASLVFVYKVSSSANVDRASSETQSSPLHDHMTRLTKALIMADKSRQRIEELSSKFDEALSQLEATDEGEDRDRLLAEIEGNLVSNMKDTNQLSGSSLGGHSIPSSNYEQLRRRVETNINEFWNFARTEVKKLEQPAPVLQLLAEHKNALLNDMQELRASDGFDQWRKEELESLSALVQKRLHYIQHPQDCNTARKLVCRLNKGCGYGCQIHHVVYCFIMAYATERTLILKSDSWRYNRAGWEQVFRPLSDTCKTSDGATHGNWPSSDDVQVVTCPIIDSLNPRPQFLPLAIPADLAPRLLRVHGDPAAWWIGQFVKYLLRFQPPTQAMIEKGVEKLNFRGPIVGVHVRRTDKVGTEAAFHAVDEYMSGVKEYFDQLQMRPDGGGLVAGEKRRVFIASDDPQVITEARKKYPDYEIIGDPSVAKSAAVSTRYSDSSLNGIILDTHLLSRCDYLVCTFSSQVCRLAYEIRMGENVDVADQYTSLDDIYYYGGQNAHNREAVLAHKPRSSKEIYLRPGDVVGIAGNHWDGFSKGHNENTNQGGLFPSFKVKDMVRITEFPTYSHVK